MRHDRHRHLLLIATLLIALVVAAPRGDVARAADPDFTNVTDILGGQRHLLRNDDLVVTAGFQGAVEAIRLPTADSSITGATALESKASSASRPNATTTGRMFNHPSDAVLIAYLNAAAELQLDVVLGDTVPVTITTTPIPTQVGDTILSMAMGDFTGDGFADLVISYGTLEPGGTGAVRIGTAGDVNNPASNVTFGPEQTTGGRIFRLAVGDFNGDGTPEIAGLILGPMSTLLVIYTVDPTTLALTQAVSVPLPLNGVPAVATAASLAAGRFGTTLHDQLVVAYNTPSSQNQLMSLDFDASLQPTVKFNAGLAGAFALTPSSATPFGGQPLIRSGRLTWFSQFDQAVVPISAGGGLQGTGVAVLTFDENLQISARFGAFIPPVPCIWDVAVGNFDAMQSNPNPPPATERDPNLSVALLGSDCGSNVTVQIFDPMSQPGFERGFWGPAFTLPANLGVVSPITLTLAAGDLQGRSLALGAPTKVTITSAIQPDLVLGVPPMHIDWINPVLSGTTPGLPPACQIPGEPSPCVLNLTVLPSVPAPGVGFSTQYAFSESAKTSAGRKSTTSWSFSTKESAEAKVSYGIPLVAQISVDAKFAAQQTHDGTVATTYNTYSGKTEGLASTTGFADHLFYTERRVNIYYYPVIGQAVCPNDQPTCADSDKLPLQVQFSGPDMVDHTDIDATTQEWYQPINEPGNVFSYPWTVAQLEQSLPDLVALAGAPEQPNWRGTDTSSSAYTSRWNQGSGSDQSSGSVSTNQRDASVTVAGQAGIEGFGISGSAGFEVNSSGSIGTLNTSTQTLDASTGIQVNKPAFSDLVADNYLYSFAGYVLGQTSPTGTLQTIPLTDEDDTPIDIQSTGPLTVAFLADPFQVNLPWWRQAYTTPDVGLNHPERWDWSKPTQTATFNPADQGSSTPQDQAFYHIKGFFITPADASGTGPQLTQATAGDTLQLQARVYNFSLADMPAGTQVHVQFYAQGYKDAQLVGNSFLIREAVLGPIPGFNSASTNGTVPNWALVGTTFDTGAFAQTQNGDVFLIFWVLVWMQDAQGNVVTELPGHGLTSGFTPSATYAQITQVPIEDYSNNVGFYGYTGNGFYIAAPGSQLAELPTQPGHLAIDSLRLESAGAILLDQKTKVMVSLRTGDHALGQLPVVFYDGEPDQGGQPFDIMYLSHLRANTTTQSRVFFRPQTCGPHTLVAVAGPATAAPATGRTSVEVTLDPVAATEALIATTQGLALPQGLANRLLATLAAAAQAFAQGTPTAGTHQLQAYMTAVQAQRGKQLAAPQADALIGQAQVILGCV